jgi:hypothetical protein
MKNYIVSTKYDGKSRRLYSKACMTCALIFYAPKHRNRKFCSQKCMGEASRFRIEVFCGQCTKAKNIQKSKINSSKHGVYFCSRKCKDKGQSVDENCPEIRPGHYIDGKFHYRKRALKQYGSVCKNCGYSEIETMLDVHHVDGDRENPSIENLEVLCVWCHALVTRGVVAQSGERLLCKQEAVGS